MESFHLLCFVNCLVISHVLVVFVLVHQQVIRRCCVGFQLMLQWIWPSCSEQSFFLLQIMKKKLQFIAKYILRSYLLLTINEIIIKHKEFNIDLLMDKLVINFTSITSKSFRKNIPFLLYLIENENITEMNDPILT